MRLRVVTVAWVVAIGPVWSVAGCASAPRAPRPAVVASVSAQTDVVAVALAHLVRSGGASAFYVAVHEGGRDRDPAPEALVRLAGRRPPVYPYSRCDVRDNDVRDRVTGSGGGVLLRVEPPRWLSDDEAELRVEYRFGRDNAANYRLRLSRSEGGWRIVEEQPLWAGSLAPLPSRS